MIVSQSPIPGSGASITTQRVTRAGYAPQRVAHHVADVVGYEVRLRDFQRVHYACDVDAPDSSLCIPYRGGG